MLSRLELSGAGTNGGKKQRRTLLWYIKVIDRIYTYFQTRTLERASAEMSLHVLSYNMMRMMNIFSVRGLIVNVQPTPPIKPVNLLLTPHSMA